MLRLLTALVDDWDVVAGIKNPDGDEHKSLNKNDFKPAFFIKSNDNSSDSDNSTLASVTGRVRSN